MDATTQYRQLARLGRAAFLASVAPAALLRCPNGDATTDYDGHDPTGTYDEPIGSRPRQATPPALAALEVLPLVKKPGAQFGDRITIGRTGNNDIVLAHHTVSRLHLYFRHRDGRWWVTDAGSKNGTAFGEIDLPRRQETAVPDGQALWIGDIAVVFQTAPSLYTLLGGL